MAGEESEGGDKAKGKVPILWEDDEELKDNPKLRLCLLGKVWTEKRVNAGAFMATMEKFWRPKHGLEAKEISENVFIFQFSHWRDKEKVLEEEPWTFDKAAIVLKEVDGNQLPSKIAETLTHTPFWVRVYDPPFSGRNENNIRKIAENIGLFLKMDDKADMDWEKSLRFKVMMDLRKPFPIEVEIATRNGGEASLKIKYERLPNICYYCGRLGHLERDCGDKSEEGVVDYTYGEWMRASPWQLRRSFKSKTETREAKSARKLFFKPEQSEVKEPAEEVEILMSGFQKITTAESTPKVPEESQVTNPMPLNDLTMNDFCHKDLITKEPSQPDLVPLPTNSMRTPNAIQPALIETKTWKRFNRTTEGRGNSTLTGKKRGSETDETELRMDITLKKVLYSEATSGKPDMNAEAGSRPRNDQ